MPLSPAQPLSTKYNVQALTITNAPMANVVPDEYEFNMANLAAVLEELESSVGPFRLASAFRSSEVQDWLASKGYPVAKGKSYHVIGLGADIVPTTMSLDEFFGRILASPIKDKFAEISRKESQDAIHLGVKYDPAQSTRVTALDDSGNYVAMGLDEIAAFAAPYLEQIGDVFSEGVSSGPRLTMPVALLLAGVAFFALSSRQRAAT